MTIDAFAHLLSCKGNQIGDWIQDLSWFLCWFVSDFLDRRIPLPYRKFEGKFACKFFFRFSCWSSLRGWWPRSSGVHRLFRGQKITLTCFIFNSETKCDIKMLLLLLTVYLFYYFHSLKITKVSKFPSVTDCLCVVADGSVNEDVVITKPFGNGRMTCREIRRNSAGCLRFREECQKCKEIQHIGEMKCLNFYFASRRIVWVINVCMIMEMRGMTKWALLRQKIYFVKNKISITTLINKQVM